MTLGRNSGRRRWLGAILAAALWMIGAPGTDRAQAAPKLRYQTDQRGDILLIGNTLGQECRAMDAKGLAIPKPVVGDIGPCGDPAKIIDSAPDVLWQSDAPMDGRAQASDNISAGQARSTAILKLPPGAQVSYARLYWAGNLTEDISLAASPVQLDRPGSGAFMVTLRPDAQKNEVVTTIGGGGGNVYQATTDVTAIVQKHGPGAYRISNVVRRTIADRDEDVQFAAWSMVIVYRSPTEPVRNIAVFDGLDSVSIGQSVDLSITGFAAPLAAPQDAKLGFIVYEGDSDKTESLTINGKPVSDGQNPPDNVFNSTRSTLGMPVSIAGDLPQLTGGAASMSGLDLDIVNVSSTVMAGDSTAAIRTSSVDDVYFVGVLVTSIRSQKPVLETTLIAEPGSVKAGEEVTMTSTTRNVGEDEAGGVVIRHPLPEGLTYVAGSLRYVSGPGSNGNKSDGSGDDEAEIGTDGMSGRAQVQLRVGKGASGSMGGSLSAGETVVVQYKLKTSSSGMGEIPTQSVTVATPVNKPQLGATEFASGNGEQPNAPTVIHIPNTSADLRVTVIKDPPLPRPDVPITYTVEVDNVGNTPDPGPLQVRFQVPPEGTIESVTPGPRWTCTQADRLITCTRPMAFEPDDSERAVEVVLRNPGPLAEGNQVTVSVFSTGAFDPNPADNTWVELRNSLRIAGGGASCAFLPGGEPTEIWTLVSTLAAMVYLTLSRRREQADSRC